MKTKLNIIGMTCANCVRHVTQALAGLPGVKEANVSLEDHTAFVESAEDTTLEAMIAAVEEEGYKAGVA